VQRVRREPEGRARRDDALNLAACREKLGQIATAWGLFLDAMRQTRSVSDAATQQLHEVAKARAQKLEPRVSKLMINVPQQSRFDGLEIARGTERVNAGLWNRALPIDGGTYTVTARAPGASQWSTHVTVAAERDTKTVEIPDLRNLPHDLDQPTAPPPVVATAIDRVPAPTNVVPLIVGAGSLVLLGSGLSFELWAESNYDAAKSEMMSLPRRHSLEDSANTKRYLAEAFAVSGLVAGGAALWLYLRDRNHERGLGAAATSAMYLVPAARGLALSGEF
jgi:hypothetical protein